MVKCEFTAVYQKKGKWYIAWIEEIPGVNTQGKSKREVMSNLKEALMLILNTNQDLARREHRGRSFREPLVIGVSG